MVIREKGKEFHLALNCKVMSHLTGKSQITDSLLNLEGILTVVQYQA
jgi:hypothetical protein